MLCRSFKQTITVIFVAAYPVLVGKITMGTLLALVQLSSSFMAPVIQQLLRNFSSPIRIWG